MISHIIPVHVDEGISWRAPHINHEGNEICYQREFGYGNAVRAGIRRAKGDLLLLIDFDGEMDDKYIPYLLAKMKDTNCDMVQASRWMKYGGVRGYSKIKYILNRTFQYIFRFLYGTKIHDLTLNYRLVKADKLKSLNLTSKDMEIAVEIMVKGIKAGWHIEEVPTVWTARKFGKSHNPLRRNWKYAKVALRNLFG